MRTRIQKPRTRVQRNTGTIVEPDKREALKAEAVKADLEDLLEEIDGLLVHNAEEFLADFRQRGGE